MKVSTAVLHPVSYVAALGAVLSLVFCGVTYGTASLMSRLAAPDQRSETKLAESIANAREIRAALAKPIPQPEPLGPITHQAATERTDEPVETKPKPKAFNTGAASTCVDSLSALLPIVRSTSRVLSSKDFEATESRLCRCLEALSELSRPQTRVRLVLWRPGFSIQSFRADPRNLFSGKDLIWSSGGA